MLIRPFFFFNFGATFKLLFGEKIRKQRLIGIFKNFYIPVFIELTITVEHSSCVSLLGNSDLSYSQSHHNAGISSD